MSHFLPKLCLLFLLLVSHSVFSQCQPWSQHLSGSLLDRATDIEIDDQGNLYITGTYQDNLTIGTDTLQDWDLQPSFFIASYTATGNLIWKKNIRANTPDASPQLSISSNMLYWMSEKIDTINFDGFGFYNSTNFRGPLLAAMDHSGQMIYLRDSYGEGLTAADMACDGSENVIFTGAFAQWMNLVFGTSPIMGFNTPSCYVVAFDDTGAVAWTRQNQGTPTTAYGRRLAVDAQNNTYVAGTFLESVQFGPYTVTGSATNTNMFLMKLNPTGNVVWLKSGFNLGPHADMYDLEVDAAGNLYGVMHLTGVMTYGNSTFGGAAGQAVLMKWNPNGNLIWVRHAGKLSTSNTLVFPDKFTDISISPKGEVYAVGSFQNGAEFNGMPIPTQGTTELKIAVYDTAGNFQGLIQYPNNGNAEVHASLFDATGSLVMLGNFDAPTYILGSSSFTNADQSGSQTDIFLARVCDTSTVITSRPDFISRNAMEIFPNPASGEVGLRFGKPFKGSLRLLDLQGRVLWKQEKVNMNAGQEMEVDLGKFEKGVYLLEISNGETRQTKKLVKM